MYSNNDACEPKLARKASVDSLSSEGDFCEADDKAAGRQDRNKSLVDLASPNPESCIKTETGAEDKHTNSASEISYPTSAKLVDHFPQKTLRASESTSRSASDRSVSSTELATTRTSLTGLEEIHNLSIDTIDARLSNGSGLEPEKSSSGSDSRLSSSSFRLPTPENEQSPSTIRFLRAYKDKTVEELMSEKSPRPTWQYNTKYTKSLTDKSSEKSMRRSYPNNGAHYIPGPEYYKASNIMQVQNSRQQPLPANPTVYQQPHMPHQLVNQHMHTYPQQQQHTQQHQHTQQYQNTQQHMQQIYRTPVSRSRPASLDIKRPYDGTHPRMSGPMKATVPYNGSYGNNQSYSRSQEPVYGSISMRRGRMQTQSQPKMPASATLNTSQQYATISENSRTYSPIYKDMRTSNSEPDVMNPKNIMSSNGSLPQNASMPARSGSLQSGKFVASSSTSNIVQYAQLMPQSAGQLARNGSSNNFNGATVEMGGLQPGQTHNTIPQQQQQQWPINDYTKHFVQEQPVTDRTNQQQWSNLATTPTSPVGRQPSYLTAMNAPVVKQRSYTDAVALDEQDFVFISGGPVTMRSKNRQTVDDSNSKIVRRTSYLMATSKPENSTVDDLEKTPIQKAQNLRKLKNFFGERTPSIREATETYTLPEKLQVNKTGILIVKVVASEGRKATDRSWKAMGAALCGQKLYLIKDKKENANMLTAPVSLLSLDEKPISVRACHIDIAHGYTKKKYVFKLLTSDGSEYLLQAEDQKDMVSWINAIDAHKNPDKASEQLSGPELIRRIQEHQQKLTNKKKPALSFKPKQPQSPSTKPADNSPRKEDKKKTHGGNKKQLEFGTPENAVGDFGIPLQECTPSHENEFVPLVVELCTKTIEEKGLEFVGIYRVPGNKASVGVLKRELAQGVINEENERWKDVNVMSSLLKDFLKSLPSSLITSEKYQLFIETSRITDSKERLRALKALVFSLPEANYETLKYLTAHLRRVAAYGEKNKMDTRNLAIVFGPTIVRSSGDVLSLVTDMSDQCRIIESIIIFHDWFFSKESTDPPNIADADISSTVVPISETMTNMTADLSALAKKKQSSSQLLTAISSVANKNISKSSLGTASKPTEKPQQRIPSSSDDHGFKNRNMQQEVAARNMRLQVQKEKGSKDSLVTRVNMVYPVQYSDATDHQFVYNDSQWETNRATLHRWHSEESIIGGGTSRRPVDNYAQSQISIGDYWHPRQVSLSDSDSTPPPLPVRGNQAVPPLPPKPHQLSRTISDQHGHIPDNYENFESLQLKMRLPKHHHRMLHVVHSSLKNGSGIQRTGSLDSMIDTGTYEPSHPYSSSTSTESQDGSDLLSSMTATFDEKLKLLVNPEYDSRVSSKQKLNSDSSSLSSFSHKGPPDSPSTPNLRGRSSTDRSRESLQSILSGKDNKKREAESSDHGFDSSNSSIVSAPIRETKVGIASRFERKDIQPQVRTPSNNPFQYPNNGIAEYIASEDNDEFNDENEESKDYSNNNILQTDYRNTPLIQRFMSDEKKKIRRRHTVGGARDFDSYKDILNSINHNIINDPNAHIETNHQALSAWQQLQSSERKEPLTIRTWLDRERFRVSSPELESNIIHLHNVESRLAHSVLQTNT